MKVCKDWPIHQRSVAYCRYVGVGLANITVKNKSDPSILSGFSFTIAFKSVPTARIT